MRFLLVILLMLVFAPAKLQAQEQQGVMANLSSAEEQTELFLQALVEGNIAGGCASFIGNSPIISDIPDAVETMTKQIHSTQDQYGKGIGFEKYRFEQFGSSYVRYIYLLKREKYPIIWEFLFYKPYDEWMLVDLYFSNDYQELKALQP